MAVALASRSVDFFENVSASNERLLMLDYDGTLAPFTVERNHAVPYPFVPEMLEQLITKCRTRVVLITGRSAQDIPALLGIWPHPEIWGYHGLCRLHTNDRFETVPVSEEALSRISKADAWLESEGLRELAEVKLGSIAVHWRGISPDIRQEVRTTALRVFELAVCCELEVIEFDGGMELRVKARDKAHAVRTLLSEAEDDLVAAYLGDDTTDEDAFRELNGKGLTVLVRHEFRSTSAQIWIRPPEELKNP